MHLEGKRPDKFSIVCMKRNEIHKINQEWANLYRHLRGTRTMRVEINESDEDTDEGPSSQNSRHRRLQHHRSIKDVSKIAESQIFGEGG